MDPAQPLMAPASLIAGRYRIETRLGRGGMGSAYRARDEVSGQTVALKILDSTKPALVKLFEREYYTLASLRHPCVIEVYDYGIEDDGRRYYSMELLGGQDLLDSSPVPWRHACELLRDVATSLALLHARKLVHRDVSPRNVRAGTGGRAKLLDFGTVMPFGLANELAGTPACLAPESLRRQTLDGRSDLFSLGVLAYWTLTGERPFAIRDFGDAELAWRSEPRAIAEFVEVPQALEQLVRSLLSVDASERPASAAEVIERLCAIADLNEDAVGVAESHLSSCPLIGRERELARMEQRFARTLQHEGSVVSIEGPEGVGRTRLASELTLRARLRGLTTLRVDSLACRDSQGGAMAGLVRALVDAAPAEARAALPARPWLFQEFEWLQQIAAAPSGLPPLPQDSQERAVRVQNDVLDWLLAVSQSRPLAIVVDDAHAIDPESAGVLIAIAHAAHRARVMLVACVLHGAPAPVPVRQLARFGSRIKLRNLSSDQVTHLTRSVCGEVPQVSRVANWLYDVSGGNPGQAVALLAGLIERGIVKVSGGVWVLPDQIESVELPKSVDEAHSRRILQLSAEAARLARLLALHRGPAELALCQQLAPGLAPAQLIAAIDELLSMQIVNGTREHCRITHESLRELLLESAGPDELRTLHRTLGFALLACVGREGVEDARRAASAADLTRALQAGFHLLRAGETTRAGAILREAGIELTNRGVGFADAVPALQAALEEYERTGRSRFERAYLMTPLTFAGMLTDWRFVYRYGEPLIPVFADAVGLSLARRLRPFFGRQLALILALLVAAVSMRFTERRLLARGFRELLLGLIGLVIAVLGNTSALADDARAKLAIDAVEPLGWLPRGHVLRIIYEYDLSLVDCGAGRYADAWRRSREGLDRLRTVKLDLREDARQQLEISFHVVLGALEVYRDDGSVRGTLAALERLQTVAARETAAGILTSYHANRGERALYEHYVAEVDRLAAQRGSTWRQDVHMPRDVWWPAVLCVDVLGLKRAYRKLERLCQDHPTFSIVRDAAHGCYLAERGRAAEALERYEAAFEAQLGVAALREMRIVSAYARILRMAGRAERARDVCQMALAGLSAHELQFTSLVHWLKLELALAKLEVGMFDEVAAELDGLLAAQAVHDNPLIHGLTHKARAQVALAMLDAEAYERHAQAMHDWFRRTDNPALMAQWRSFTDHARRALLVQAGTPPANSVERASYELDLDRVRRQFLGSRGPTERLQLAIDVLVESSGATHGYLYLCESDGLRFAAPVVGVEPPPELLVELNTRMAAVEALEDATVAVEYADTDAVPTHVDSERARDPEGEAKNTTAGTPYGVVLLRLETSRGPTPIAAVALVPGDELLAPIDGRLVQAVAQGIYEGGDFNTSELDSRVRTG